MNFYVQTSQLRSECRTARVLVARRTRCQGLVLVQTLNFDCRSPERPAGQVIQSSHCPGFDMQIQVSPVDKCSQCAQRDLPLSLPQNVAPQTQGRRRGLASCGGSALLQVWRVHVLPITDKRKAVLDSMWFHLEQVKQCRKIDPSSVAFQRPVRNSSKSYRANPARNCRGTKAAGARAVVTSLRRARAYLLTFGGFTLTETSPPFSLFWCHCGLLYCFSSNRLVFWAGLGLARGRIAVNKFFTRTQVTCLGQVVFSVTSIWCQLPNPTPEVEGRSWTHPPC